LLLISKDVNQLGQLMQPERLHNRSRANVTGYAEKKDERSVGQLNTALFVQQQKPFGHAVENCFLLGLYLKAGLRLCLSKLLQGSFGFLLSQLEFAPPPKVQRQRCRQSEDRQEWPEHL
jgi:hypothetical protein